VTELAQVLPNLDVEIVMLSGFTKGFAVLPQAWGRRPVKGRENRHCKELTFSFQLAQFCNPT
jgi:hypothetical protein